MADGMSNPGKSELATVQGCYGLPASEFVQTLEKGLAVIRCFGEDTPTRTLVDVAKAVGLTRAAARRLVLTLEVLGYVERSGRDFRLRPQILELGYSYMASQPWWRHAHTVISHLGNELGCACAAGVLDREAVAYMAYSPGGNTPQVVRSIGTRLPAYATAMGRVLLASLDEPAVRDLFVSHPPQGLTPFTLQRVEDLLLDLRETRSRGYGVVDQQLELGLFSIGIPIYDRGGRVLAALSASLRGRAPPQEKLETTFLRPMRQASRAITAGLST